MRQNKLLRCAICLAWLFAYGSVQAESDAPSDDDSTIIPPDQYTLFQEVKSWFVGQDAMRTHPSQSKNSILVLPIIVVNPMVGVGGGASGRYDFQLVKNEETSFSSLALTGTITSNHQYKLSLTNLLYTNHDHFNILGGLHWRDWPRNTYGLGANSPGTNETVVGMKEIMFTEQLWSEVFRNMFVGVGYKFSYMYKMKDVSAQRIQDNITDLRERGEPLTDEEAAALREEAEARGIDVDTFPTDELAADIADPEQSAEEIQQRYFLTPFQDYPYGTGDTNRVSSLMIGLRYDSRDNLRNAERGLLLGFEFNESPTWLGSTTSYQTIFSEARTYYRLPFSHRQILAFWMFGWFSFGEVPYFSLPATGEDFMSRSARGYYQGRYRGEHMLYGEIEYRVQLWRWLGGVAFVNLGSVTEPDSGDFEYVIPGGGGGLRFLLNRNARMNLSLDFAAGKQGSYGTYLNVNEAF